MTKIMVLHGPNLKQLGQRETNIYGSTTLEQINQSLIALANKHGHQLYSDQSNSEGHLIDLIVEAKGQEVEYMIFNPAGYTHTSVALRDALLSAAIPFIEVHLSNIYKRESFRHFSYFSDIAMGTISGFGPESYTLALKAIITKLESK